VRPRSAMERPAQWRVVCVHYLAHTHGLARFPPGLRVEPITCPRPGRSLTQSWPGALFDAPRAVAWGLGRWLELRPPPTPPPPRATSRPRSLPSSAAPCPGRPSRGRAICRGGVRRGCASRPTGHFPAAVQAYRSGPAANSDQLVRHRASPTPAGSYGSRPAEHRQSGSDSNRR
jgi:hypothetical protein